MCVSYEESSTAAPHIHTLNSFAMHAVRVYTVQLHTHRTVLAATVGGGGGGGGGVYEMLSVCVLARW